MLSIAILGYWVRYSIKHTFKKKLLFNKACIKVCGQLVPTARKGIRTTYIYN